MKRLIQNRFLLSFVLLALLLITIGVVSYWSVFNFANTSNAVSHTQVIIEKLENILSELKDAETGQRGYLLTGQESYLEPYDLALPMIPQKLADLRNLTADSSKQQIALTRLDSLIVSRLGILKEVLNVRREQGLEAALKLVKTDQGKQTMDAIRQVIKEMDSEERVLLEQRQSQQQISNQTTLILVTLLLVLNFCFFGLVYYYFNRDIANRRQVTLQLQSYNTELEKRVSDRTAQLKDTNKNLESEIVERNQTEKTLRFLTEVSTLLASSLDYEATLQRVAAITVPLLADYCMFDLVKEESQYTFERVALAHSDPQKEALIRKIDCSYQPEVHFHPLTQVLNSGEPELVTEITPTMLQALAYDPEYLALLQTLNPHSIMSVPLMIRDYKIGVLTLGCSDSGRHYETKDLVIAKEVARRAAISVDNARLFEEAQKSLSNQKELDYLKDLFMSMVGHELRTPLTSIRAYAQMIQLTLVKQIEAAACEQAQTAQAKSLRSVENIIRQTYRMNEMIKQLLDFSRVQGQKMGFNFTSGINIVELVEQIVERQRLTTNDHILVFETQEKEILATYDPDRLEQVLDNLINNAIKYSPPDTTVTIRIEQPKQEAGEIIISVSDQGFGISEGTQVHVFERFYRVQSNNNPKVDGLGLGLYISYEIITQQGGRMWLTSQVGQGSTFYIALPLKPPQSFSTVTDAAITL